MSVAPFLKEGITLAGIHAFIDECGGRDVLVGLTTTNVNDQFQKPSTMAQQCSYCNKRQADGQRSPHVRTATVYISHAWAYLFLEVVDALENHFRDESDAVLWFDLFSNNQHITQQLDFDWWCNTFKSIIADVGRIVMVLSPWQHPVTLTRAWCLWDLLCTHETGSVFEVAIGSAARHAFISDICNDCEGAVKGMLSNINVENCQCFYPQDLANIKAAVFRSVGFNRINKSVLQLMNSWMISAVYSELLGELDEFRYLQLQSALGTLHRLQGNFELAEPLYIDTLRVRRTRLGDDHPDTLASRSNLVALYQAQGRYELAEDIRTKQEYDHLLTSQDISGKVELTKRRRLLRAALARGKKEWGRSKIMIVGEGRAGKTALANSIIGRAFADTESTIGINQLSCDVKQVAVDSSDELGGKWGECDKPDNEFQAELGRVIHTKQRPRASIKRATAATAIPPSTSVRTLYHDGVNPSRTVSDTTKDRATDSFAIVAKSSKGITIGHDLEMKCLAESVSIFSQSKLIISIYDFGGQSVFDVIHPFFLTRFGVYVLVFNMEWLITGDVVRKQSCLDYLKFWLNSVVVHTSNDQSITAPIVLVGTNKDSIKDSGHHNNISVLLQQEFGDNVAWPYILKYRQRVETGNEINLCFFPVDNTLGQQDPTMKVLLDTMEKCIAESDYVQEEKPLSWLQTFDKMMDTKENWLSFSKIVQLAAECEVTAEEIPVMLQFLFEMGMLMWHNEPGLSDVVIMNPIEYFVTPATLVICKHRPSDGDATRHFTDIHRECQINHPEPFYRLYQGIVSETLLRALLREYEGNYDKIVQLMEKYSLIVPVRLRIDSGNTDKEYIVPALLQQFSLRIPWSDISSSFAFVFSIRHSLEDHEVLTPQILQSECFLPSGLFERLIGKALLWSQQTGDTTYTLELEQVFKNAAVLRYGDQRFCMRAVPKYNLIHVDVEGSNPISVHSRLHDQISRIVSESMASLIFTTVLHFSRVDYDSIIATTTSLQYLNFISLTTVMAAFRDRSLLLNGYAYPLMQIGELKSRYGSWVQVLTKYDMFLSYRRPEYDSAFTEALYDEFTQYAIEEPSRDEELVDCPSTNGNAIANTVAKAVNWSHAEANQVVEQYLDVSLPFSGENINTIMAAFLIQTSDLYCQNMYNKPLSYFTAFGAIKPDGHSNHLQSWYHLPQRFYDKIIRKQFEASAKKGLNLELLKLFIAHFKLIAPDSLIMSDMLDCSTLMEKFRDNRQVLLATMPNYVVVTGTGVSVAIAQRDESRHEFNPVTWEGLLDCIIDELNKFNQDANSIPRRNDLEPLGKAQIIFENIQQQHPYLDYRQFVSMVMRSIQTSDLDDSTNLSRAIDRLGLPIATTNYDLLLEDKLRRFEFNLTNDNAVFNPNLAHRFIYHLHGVWFDSNSVVLRQSEYDTSCLAFKGAVQKLLFEMPQTDGQSLMRSFLFIGCGGGMVDDHFNALFTQQDFDDLRHVTLLTRSEIEKLWNELPRFRLAVQSDRLIPVCYGEKYSDLPAFIEGLRTQN